MTILVLGLHMYRIGWLELGSLYVSTTSACVVMYSHFIHDVHVINIRTCHVLGING